jgi:hypothetical protein
VKADNGGGTCLPTPRSLTSSQCDSCDGSGADPYTGSDQSHGPNASHDIPLLVSLPVPTRASSVIRLRRDYSAVKPV